MPNWCNNNITITGPAHKINKIWAEAIKDDSGLLNAIVPMPTALRETVKGSGDENQTELHDGYTNWYDWSVARWSTKWDVSTEGLEYDESDGVATITGWFDSAWAPPTQAMETYGAENPDVLITLDYHEPGMCFVGRTTIENGEAEDDCIDYADCNSKTVREMIGADFDDEWAISENMEMWEND